MTLGELSLSRELTGDTLDLTGKSASFGSGAGVNHPWLARLNLMVMVLLMSVVVGLVLGAAAMLVRG